MIEIDNIVLTGKKVFIRADLNVPFDDQGNISDQTRILAALPLIKKVLLQNARVMLTSHRGRPKEGQNDPSLSLAPIATCIGNHLQRYVKLVTDWIGKDFDLSELPMGELVLLENCRFNEGEKSNNQELARRLGSMCDVYINDAFATAHRKEATTYGIAQYAPVAIAGALLKQEIDSLEKALENPNRPLTVIVGGSKVSTKLLLLSHLSKKVDQLIIGGGIMNTFLLASGKPIGKSLCEIDLVSEAKKILQEIQFRGGTLPLPTDVVVADEFSKKATGRICEVDDIRENEMILDIGPRSSEYLKTLLQGAKTIVWNGPVGVFEFPAFRKGTESIAQAISESSAFSLAGGGDTIAAINLFELADQIDYISTAGGAFLEYLEGKTLPGVEILEQRSRG